MEAFVYVWTDCGRNMLYIGKHKGPQDDGYVCSSKVMLKEYKERPKDFTRQIVACGADKEMLIFEQRIIKASGAVKDPHYYNKANWLGHHTCAGFHNKGRIPWNKGKKATPEACANQSASHKGQTPWMKGKAHTPEANEQNRIKHLGRTPWNRGLRG